MTGRRITAADLVVPAAAALVGLALVATLVWAGLGGFARVTGCPEPMVRIELSDGVAYCAKAPE